MLRRDDDGPARRPLRRSLETSIGAWSSLAAWRTFGAFALDGLTSRSARGSSSRRCGSAHDAARARVWSPAPTPPVRADPRADGDDLLLGGAIEQPALAVRSARVARRGRPRASALRGLSAWRFAAMRFSWPARARRFLRTSVGQAGPGARRAVRRADAMTRREIQDSLAQASAGAAHRRCVTHDVEEAAAATRRRPSGPARAPWSLAALAGRCPCARVCSGVP